MNKITTYFTMLPIIWIVTACCPVGKVKINPTATSPPDIFWEMTHSTGGQTEIINDEQGHISLPSGHDVSVVLKGRDNVSGIKSLKINGGFGFTCKVVNSEFFGEAYAGHGFYPENTEEFQADGNDCALRVAAYSQTFSISRVCQEGEGVIERGYFFQAEATNHAGLKTSATLSISTVPDATLD